MDLQYMQEKRLKVLKEIKPICEAFNITDYDYIVKETGQKETLRIAGTKIRCSCNSINGVINELIGWIFVNIYCKQRYIGAFKNQTLNVIKQYWL